MAQFVGAQRVKGLVDRFGTAIAPSIPPNMATDGKEEMYEEEHVHRVYQEIAHHFSSTRYKAWPIVERFLTELAPGSVGLDIGCGNGKYLPVNPNIFIIASDRSEALIKIASKHQPHSTVIADNLSLPHPNGRFDFAISIAVVHHLSTRERRVKAVEAILDTLKPPQDSFEGGKALIYVWALEQKNSRRGWDAGDEQDVMVPWVRRGKGSDKSAESTQTFLRYYHLYRSNELEDDICAAGGRVLNHGYEKDNWWAIATPLPR
ncbi:tRNA methyltransferase, has a role in tRNA modification [Coccidioides posadasii str. Silveira]|nr:tRNA methyltransferase, has a role in tRNA modification [Coccidioides posadasii str. Silveira]